MKRIIIDCDPGQDDAIAITLAENNNDKLYIEGIVTVGGNNNIEHITNNAQVLLQILKSKNKLIKGSKTSLLNKIFPQEVHGKTGMDGISNIPIINYPIAEISFMEFYKKIIENNKITIVAIGPLTNIALLIKSYPDIIKNIEEIVFMGGSLNGGNITDYAEFNIFVDPEAAKIVFESGIKLTMFGLDVTEHSYLLEEEYYTFSKGNYLAKSIYELLYCYHNNGKKYGYNKCSLHDACAIVYLLNPDIFEFEEKNIEVSLSGITRGMTLENKNNRNKYNIKFAKNVNRLKFKELIINNILEIDRKIYD